MFHVAKSTKFLLVTKTCTYIHNSFILVSDEHSSK